MSDYSETAALLRRVSRQCEHAELSVDDLHKLDEEVCAGWARIADRDDRLIGDAFHFITHYISDMEIAKNDAKFAKLLRCQLETVLEKLDHGLFGSTSR